MQSLSSLLPDAELVPAGHAEHCPTPTALLCVSSSHAVHADPSDVPLYPAKHLQSVNAPLPDAEPVPAGHAVQSSPHVPAAQGAQETPVPEKPVLHAHVKAPSVSVHAALMSQLLVSSAIERQVPSPLLSRHSVRAIGHLEYGFDSGMVCREGPENVSNDHGRSQSLISSPNVDRQNVMRAAARPGPVHSSMLAQATPVPEKPVLHAHVKAPSVSVHAALVSQLWVPSVTEGRGPSPLLSLQNVVAEQRYVVWVLGAVRSNTYGSQGSSYRLSTKA